MTRFDVDNRTEGSLESENAARFDFLFTFRFFFLILSGENFQWFTSGFCCCLHRACVRAFEWLAPCKYASTKRKKAREKLLRTNCARGRERARDGEGESSNNSNNRERQRERKKMIRLAKDSFVAWVDVASNRLAPNGPDLRGWIWKWFYRAILLSCSHHTHAYTRTAHTNTHHFLLQLLFLFPFYYFHPSFPISALFLFIPILALILEFATSVGVRMRFNIFSLSIRFLPRRCDSRCGKIVIKTHNSKIKWYKIEKQRATK